MRTRALIALSMFLTLVPVTLLVPGLHELVVTAHGGTTGDAHAFMTVNMIAGMLTVPFAMRIARTTAIIRRWIVFAFVADALAFVGMGVAPSLGVLYAFRVLDGAVHLPAVTLVMLAGNRAAGVHRGGTLGAVAAAIMIGVAVGSPLGGWLVVRGPAAVYGVGAALLVIGAVVSLGFPSLPAPATGTAPRSYAFDGARLRAWVPLGYGFMDRFSIGVFVSTFTLFMTEVHALTAPQRGILIALFMLPFALLSYPAGRLADRIGWFAPMMTGNVLFGLVFAAYGIVPKGWLPAAMVASGVLSALMFTPSLLLVSDLARRGHGEGLFGAFQVAGSLGFLTGPMVGGALMAALRGGDRLADYRIVFALVGVMEALLALVAWTVLRGIAREGHAERERQLTAAHATSPSRTGAEGAGA